MQQGIHLERPQEFPLRASVEVPTAWMMNPVDGDRHRQFITNVIGGVARLGLPIDFVDAPWGGDSAERMADPGSILFSYHTVGKSKNVWRLKEAPIPPLYAIDRYGHSGWSEIANDQGLQERAKSYNLAKARTVIESYRIRFLSKNESKYTQPEAVLELPEKFVFLALQVQSDPVSAFAYIDAGAILLEAARFAQQYQCYLLVKRHPWCNSTLVSSLLAKLTNENPWVRQVDGSIHQLIPAARSVVTVNSGVGLEALIHGKPVYAAGLSEWLPAAVPVRSPDELEAAFSDRQFNQTPDSISYIGYLLSEYWINGLELEAVYNRIKSCIREYEPTSRKISPADEIRKLRIELLKERAKTGATERELVELRSSRDVLTDQLAKVTNDMCVAALEQELIRNELAAHATDISKIPVLATYVRARRLIYRSRTYARSIKSKIVS